MYSFEFGVCLFKIFFDVMFDGFKFIVVLNIIFVLIFIMNVFVMRNLFNFFFGLLLLLYLLFLYVIFSSSSSFRFVRGGACSYVDFCCCVFCK